MNLKKNVSVAVVAVGLMCSGTYAQAAEPAQSTTGSPFAGTFSGVVDLSVPGGVRDIHSNAGRTRGREDSTGYHERKWTGWSISNERPRHHECERSSRGCRSRSQIITTSGPGSVIHGAGPTDTIPFAFPSASDSGIFRQTVMNIESSYRRSYC